MEVWQALLLGLVQGLTEFLPVSSSGHLMIFKSLFGVDGEGFLDFTVTVHLATVLSTIVAFRGEIWALLRGLFRFRYNDETDYVLKIVVSMVPVGIVGVFFKDFVEGLFSEGLEVVALGLFLTSVLLVLSWWNPFKKAEEGRNGISFLQAFFIGLAQAFAVVPGLSRSGATISTGLMAGVKKENVAQFSFLMVLAPIIGEQLLEVLKSFSEGGGGWTSSVGCLPLLIGFFSAFFAGLLACKVMIKLVKKSGLAVFALYCAAVATCIVLFSFL